MLNSPRLITRNMAARHILLRADADQNVGFGHVMRSVTLGASLKERGFNVSLVTSGLPPFLRLRAVEAGIIVTIRSGIPGGEVDALDLIQRRPDLLIADGYFFEEEFFSQLTHHDVPYVFVDDEAERYPSDAVLIINQNYGVEASQYPNVSHERLLLGSCFAMVRKEVQRLRPKTPKTRVGEPFSVLVAVGGTDVRGVGAQLAPLLAKFQKLRVVGAGSSHHPNVVRADIDIAAELASVDLAVIGGGTTMWEAMCLGIPSLVLVVADNQLSTSRRVSDSGLASRIDCRNRVDFGKIVSKTWEILDDSNLRLQMALRGHEAIDGFGVERTADAVAEII